MGRRMQMPVVGCAFLFLSNPCAADTLPTPELTRLPPNRIALLENTANAVATVYAVARNRSTGPAQWSRLLNHSDPSIALYGYYRQVVHSQDGAADKKPVLGEFERFTGYLDCLTGVTAPEWWVALGQGAARPGGAFRLRDLRRTRLNDKWSTYFTQVAIEENRFRFACQAGTVTLSSDAIVSLSKETIPHPEMIEATVDNERLYVGIYDHVGHLAGIVAYNRATKSRVWVNTVWCAGGENFGIRGLAYHAVSINAAKGKVVVHGCSSFGLYTEVFDAASGMPLVRFSSTLWSNEDLR